MKNGTSRVALAACSAFAMISAVAVMPAVADTMIYPGGYSVDQSNRQMNTSNSGTYNPLSTTGTVDTWNRENPANYPGGIKNDCASKVGNSKLECAHNLKMNGGADNSNNPDQLN